MARCRNCGWGVAGNAPYCPNCGNPEPGAGQDDAMVIGFGLVVVLICGLFLAPAIIVIWPFSEGLWDAFKIAFGSLWGWLGSIAFWLTLGGFIAWLKSAPQEEPSQPVVTYIQTSSPAAPPRPIQTGGRFFQCRSCKQQIQEPNRGDLGREGVICPHCNAKNKVKAATR